MTFTISSPSAAARRPRRPVDGASSRSGRRRARRTRAACPRRRVLGRYVGPDGNSREVFMQPGAAGSMLVLDRPAGAPGDHRLVAHLGGDEPATNAALVCALYLEQARHGGGRCRQVSGDDLVAEPFAQEKQAGAGACAMGAPVDRRGFRYRIEALQGAGSMPQLRWCARPSPCAQARPMSVRDVVARLERYEPACALTEHALRCDRAGAEVSTAVLRAELRRLRHSPIVLNRKLRATVLATIRTQELSMSEIATRCGRVKVDGKGHASGETSWLARRLGLLPEAGQSAPTPWIHSDVLALIARSGLGISPREVEADADELTGDSRVC